MDQILQGIRVLDFSSWLAGPYASAVLADYGAEVIWIEPPGGNKDQRDLEPRLPNGSNILFGVNLLPNKKDITLNLSTEEGQELANELIKKSDVVIHNFTLGTRREKRFRYESLKELNPRIVVAGVSGFGKYGPYAKRVAFDSIAQAMGGAMTFTGFPDDPPTKDGLGYADLGSGLYTALGVMLALYHRQKTGKGQEVDIALFDVVSSFVGEYGIAAEYKFFGKQIRGQVGNHFYGGYINTFRAKDGWVSISCASDTMFERTCRAIGREDILEDPRFKDNVLRWENREALDSVIGAWTSERTRSEVVETLQGARATCGPVNYGSDLATDPQLKERKMLVDVEVPDVGKILAPGVVLKFSETPMRTKEGVLIPEVGQHNEEVYCGFLGLSSERLQELKGNGVI